MAKQPPHHERVAWRKAMDLAEQVYRLTQRFPESETHRLTRQLAEAAAALPGRTVLGEAGASRSLEAGLLHLETLLLLAVRLRYLAEAEAGPVLALLHSVPETAAATHVPPSPPAAPPTAPSRSAPPVAPTRSAPPAAPTPSRPAVRDRRTPAPETHALDRLVVDGCNFLGRAAGYDLADPASRDRLLLRLQEYAHEHPGHRVAVFFDGQRTSRQVVGGVEAHVTSGQRPADDVIVDFLRGLSPPDRPRALLVTDDRNLSRRARDQGVRSESVVWLAEKLTPQPPFQGGARREPGMPRAELSEWEEFFRQPPQRPK